MVALFLMYIDIHFSLYISTGYSFLLISICNHFSFQIFIDISGPVRLQKRGRSANSLAHERAAEGSRAAEEATRKVGRDR